MKGQPTAEQPLARISLDPSKRSGQACIRNLRITVKDVLEYLAGGMSEQEIPAEFPDLQPEDFAAVYAYAAAELVTPRWFKVTDGVNALDVRLLFDQNLPPSLTLHLSDIFPGSIHVRDIGLSESPDAFIWDYAKAFLR